MILIIEESSTARLQWQRITMSTTEPLEIVDSFSKGLNDVSNASSKPIAIVIGTIISYDKIDAIKKIKEAAIMPIIVCAEHDENFSLIMEAGADKIIEKPVQEKTFQITLTTLIPGLSQGDNIKAASAAVPDNASLLDDQNIADKVVDLIERKVRKILMQDVVKQVETLQAKYFSLQLPAEIEACVDKMDFGRFLTIPAVEKKAILTELETSLISIMESKLATAVTELKAELSEKNEEVDTPDLTFELDSDVEEDEAENIVTLPDAKAITLHHDTDMEQRTLLTEEMISQVNNYTEQWLIENKQQWYLEQSLILQQKITESITDSGLMKQLQEKLLTEVMTIVNEQFTNLLSEQMTIAILRLNDNEKEIKALSVKVSRLTTLLLITTGCVFGTAALLLV